MADKLEAVSMAKTSFANVRSDAITANFCRLFWAGSNVKKNLRPNRPVPNHGSGTEVTVSIGGKPDHPRKNLSGAKSDLIGSNEILLLRKGPGGRFKLWLKSRLWIQFSGTISSVSIRTTIMWRQQPLPLYFGKTT